MRRIFRILPMGPGRIMKGRDGKVFTDSHIKFNIDTASLSTSK